MPGGSRGSTGAGTLDGLGRDSPRGDSVGLLGGVGGDSAGRTVEVGSLRPGGGPMRGPTLGGMRGDSGGTSALGETGPAGVVGARGPNPPRGKWPGGISGPCCIGLGAWLGAGPKCGMVTIPRHVGQATWVPPIAAVT